MRPSPRSSAGSIAATADVVERRQATRGSGRATADALRRALDELDEPAAQAVLDRLLTDFTVETVLRDVVVPYLHELGSDGSTVRSASLRSTSPAT